MPRIYYIRLMALAALYKWITSTDQIDQVELDKMIQKYPFAQNLQIVKALSQVGPVHDLQGQMYSLASSWYHYVRYGMKEDKVHAPAPISDLDRYETDHAKPIHVSDGENYVVEVADPQVILFDVPWAKDDPKLEESALDWTSTETILFDKIGQSDIALDEKKGGDLAKPTALEIAEDQHKSDHDKEELVIQEKMPEELNTICPEVNELSIDEPLILTKDEEQIIQTDDVNIVTEFQAPSAFSQWLILLKPTEAPAGLVELKVNKKDREEVSQIIQDNLAEAKEGVINEDAVKPEINNKEDGQLKTTKKDKEKKKIKNKKSKKANKSRAKSKQAKKNKKLVQKLRKKKRKQEKLKSKLKKYKKEEKLRRIKKGKEQLRRSKKKKKSRRSIEAILKNKASKNGKKKKKGNNKSKDGYDGRDDKKGEFDLRLASEPLANLLWLQGHRKKAIKMFEDLGLKMPEKKAYFAAQIEKLKKKKK